MPDALDVRSWLLGQIAAGADADLATRAADHFGVTRQAVSRHLRRMLDSGEIVAEGYTRARRYRLAALEEFSQVYELDDDFHEDLIWSQSLLPLVRTLPPNVLEICAYGVTEMLNNARDHSGAADVCVKLVLTVLHLKIGVLDGGVGIFQKIKRDCGLEDERHAVFELTKGKLTTDPEHHTGEGIFFTSRAVDVFHIASGALSLIHKHEAPDWLIDLGDPKPGTYVSMTMQTDSRRSLQGVFASYATKQDDYGFQRTHLVVALAQTEGTSLISRSQAKRIMARCERFREIDLDFQGVESIGPAFADEIFRVWQRSHPNVTLVPGGMTEAVAGMVRRASTAAQEPVPPET